jgi:hypothetical protein
LFFFVCLFVFPSSFTPFQFQLFLKNWSN